MTELSLVKKTPQINENKLNPNINLKKIKTSNRKQLTCPARLKNSSVFQGGKQKLVNFFPKAFDPNLTLCSPAEIISNVDFFSIIKSNYKKLLLAQLLLFFRG